MSNDIWKISALFGLSLYHLTDEYFLRNHTHLLRQQCAASWSSLHDDRGGHNCAPQATAGSRNFLFNWNGRARDKYRACSAEDRAHSQRTSRLRCCLLQEDDFRVWPGYRPWWLR